MSVQSEITRLADAKAAIKTAIESKGVTVPDATMLDGMAALIDAIETGGGDVTINGLKVASGTFTMAETVSSGTYNAAYVSGVQEEPTIIVCLCYIAANFPHNGTTKHLLGAIKIPYKSTDISFGGAELFSQGQGATPACGGSVTFFGLYSSSYRRIQIGLYTKSDMPLIAGTTYGWVCMYGKELEN